MRATFTPFRLHGRVTAPSSKSMAHRYLIGAALSGKECTLSGVDFNEDILATIDCINSVGIKTIIENNAVIVEGCRARFLEKKEELPRFFCRESGSTLRFMIPLAMLGGGGVFGGTPRLISRGIGIYEELFSGKAKDPQANLKELIGHTPFQVAVGALLGFSVAFALCTLMP